MAISPEAQEAVDNILAGVRKSLRESGRQAKDQADASNVAALLREAADCYDGNDIGHGRKCLFRAFTYAQVLRRQGMASALPATMAAQNQRARIENLILAMRIAHEPTLEAIEVHYDAVQFLDTFSDEW